MNFYKRIALFGAVANPNIGDEAILCTNIQHIKKMYGTNCKIYIFTKDASYTSIYSNDSSIQICPIHYLHQITLRKNFNIEEMKKSEQILFHHPDSDLETKILHKIFQEIDILHIIGGGYLNSLWPDILYEAVIAARLAKFYDKKYILTGISIFPLEDVHKKLVQELLNGAEYIDFRDNCMEKLSINFPPSCQVSIDDAIYMEDIYPNSFRVQYANLLFHNWNEYTEVIIDKINTEIIPFMEECISKDEIHHFNILGFSKGDIELWNHSIPLFSEQLSSSVHFIDLTVGTPVEAKHLITCASFNIGSRYHMAVFSLSANIPVFNVIASEYYHNKLESLHQFFNSKSYCSIETVSKDQLHDFVLSCPEIKSKLKDIQPNIHLLYENKCHLIAQAYGVNKTDAGILEKKLLDSIEMPKITVIIPIYNQDAYIRECLDSVISQTLKEIEIICIDDGSTDYTLSVLNEYAWKDHRIKIISHPNHGVAYSRNTGIEHAEGEFLFFLDPDDWLPDNNVFKDMYDTAKENHVLICGGSFKEYTPFGCVESWSGNLSKYTFEKEGILSYRDYQFDYGWVRFIYNREFILYNNLRIPSYKFFEDPVFFVRAMHKAEYFYAMKRFTYCYRTGHKSNELSYNKIVDLLNAITENITFAIENDYNELLCLELSRLKEDYAPKIINYLTVEENNELRDAFHNLNQIIFQSNNKIEYQMFEKIIYNDKFTIDNNLQLYDSELKRIYTSSTWKLGNFLLRVPKKIKLYYQEKKRCHTQQSQL